MTEPTSAPSGGGLAPNVASLLCYLCGFITGLIFIFIEKEDKDVRFHAWQSIFFGVALVILSGAINIVIKILLAISLGLAFIGSLLNLLLSLGILGIWIFLMIKAYQGERFKLPFIGDLAEKQLANETA